MNGLTLIITAVIGGKVFYRVTTAEGATVSAGMQRIHRTRPDAKPSKQKRSK